MTGMRRVTISVPETMDKRLLALRRKKEFERLSYSEIVRRMVELGMSANRIPDPPTSTDRPA